MSYHVLIEYVEISTRSGQNCKIVQRQHGTIWRDKEVDTCNTSHLELREMYGFYL